MNQGMVLRLFGCAFASFFAFLVCMLVGSELLGPSVAAGFGRTWEILVSLAIATAFGWAFWVRPGKKRVP